MENVQLMNLKETINTFFEITGFKLCDINADKIVLEDKDKNKKEIFFPINFKSEDELLTLNFRKNEYYIKINSIVSTLEEAELKKFNISYWSDILNYGNLNESLDINIDFNNKLYNIYISKVHDRETQLTYQMSTNDLKIKIKYDTAKNYRRLEIREIYILPEEQENLIAIEYKINDKEHSAYMISIENDKDDILEKEINEEEINTYFNAMASSVKNIINSTNTGVQTLNNNIFKMLLRNYEIFHEFMNMVNSVELINESLIDLLNMKSNLLNIKNENFNDLVIKYDNVNENKFSYQKVKQCN